MREDTNLFAAQKLGPMATPPEDPNETAARELAAIQEAFDEEMTELLGAIEPGMRVRLPENPSQDEARIQRLQAAIRDTTLPSAKREAILGVVTDLIRRQAGLPAVRRLTPL